MVVAAVGGHDRAAEGQPGPALPGQPFGVVDPLPQAQRPVVVAVGLGGRSDPLGHPPRLYGGPQRPGEVVAGEIVVGQLGRRGEQAGERGMEPGALARQQVGVDGLLQQRVAEGVAVALDPEQAARDDLAHRLLELGQRQPRHLAQQLVLDPAPGHGGGAQHPLPRLREHLDPGHQQAGQPVGQGVALGHGREQLLGIERVAVGAGDDETEPLGVDLAQSGDIVGHLAGAQRPQLHVHHCG